MSHPGTHDALEGIAIIGMAGRFPGADTLAAFWHNLRDGVESISTFSAQDLEAAGIDPAVLDHPNYVKAYGALEGIERFDAAFFGLRPREAEIMDPQHRLFLECAWEALEHAAYDTARYSGAVGVYAGVGVDAYALVNLLPNRDLMHTMGNLQTSIRNRTDHLTTHVSYKLNLRGPGVTVQTACSTSLVAVHLACQSLLNGECDIALAGGVSLAVPQKTGYLYQEGGILSPDGHCRAFDARAQGCVGGSGVGIVVLKKLAEAMADGDRVYAVIKGSAINNDGAVKVGYTAPSVDGQASVIAEALALAEVHPETVSYIEAHGTGTALGDPIEVEALTRAFRASTARQGFCALGAVKTNIGHLDAAAGVAGLIKTVLALQHHQIPPSLHFEQPNPRIDFARSPFYVNTRLTEWPTGDTPRRAGVSSFGMGGTNAHVVLEEAPVAAASSSSRPWQLLLLSAKTSTGLENTTARLTDYLQQHPDINLADVAYTLQVGRRVFGQRRAIVCQGGDAVTALAELHPGRVYTGAQEPKTRPVVFMFPGQGAQYVHMGAELYQVEPTFRKQIDLCSELLTPHLGLDLRQVLYPRQTQAETAAETLKQTYLTQPALFTVEYALAQLWMEWGVQPEAMIGHSIGEYVAACLAGVFSLEDALALVAARGRLMQSLPGGAMLAVRLAEKDVQPWLGQHLSLAASNGPKLCVLSGPTSAIDALTQQLTAQGVGCRRLHTSHAFHSQMMDPILDDFAAEVRSVKLQAPRLPFVSNVTGSWMTADEATDPGYWARHLRHTVRFAEGVQALVHDPDWVLLEVGPGQTLMTFARWHPQRAAGQVVLTSMRPADTTESDVAFLLTTLGRLWLTGVQVDWHGYYAHERRQRLPLPTYPFEPQRYWIDPPQQAYDARSGPGALQKKPNITEWFYVPSWKRSPPLPLVPATLAEHTGCWLVLVDACGLGARLVHRLEQLGQDVVPVLQGEGFHDLGAHGYRLHPRQGEDYVALLQALRAQGKTPDRVVHCWGVAPQAETAARTEDLARVLDCTFYSLLCLAQALGADDLTTPLHLAVLTTQMQDVFGDESLCPEKATVIGPCRAIPKEYPHVTCQSIDLVLPQAGSRQEEQLVDQLIAELTTTPADVVLAYRGQHRWVQAFEPVRLAAHTGRPPRLREGGIYLITGGLGGIGLELATYLARTMQAKLVLTGRSAFPARQEWGRWLATHDEQDEVSRKIRKVQGLEQLGAEVLVLSADVAQAEHMQTVLARTCERFGQPHGIIHAAGLAGGGMMQLKTLDMAASVLAPKIQGTRVLEALCQDMPLDFLLLCSSRSAILGGFGQADYCAANAFLDAFAHTKTSSQTPCTVSINWGAWQEVGMRVNTLTQLGLQAAPPTSSPQNTAHPLLEQCIHETPEQDIYVTQFNVAKHWVLDDHRIVKRAVIPGVAYLEMARAAVEKHAGQQAIELRDVCFLTPVGVRDDETREVRTILEKDGEGFAFRMFSKPVSNNGDTASWQECAFGKAGLLPVQTPKQHAIQELIARCNVDDIIATDEPLTHEDLGPRWQNLKRAYIGHHELVTVLELSEEFVDDLEHFKFHPALLDRTNGAAKTYLTGRGLYMPMSYKRLQINAPLPRKLYAYHTYKAQHDPSMETITFNVILMDEHGVELAEIEEFSQKKVHETAEPIRAVTDSTYRRGEGTPAPSPDTVERQGRSAGEGAEQEPYHALSEGMSPAEGVEAFHRILCSTGLPQIVVSPRDLQASIQLVQAATHQRIVAGIEQLEISRPAHPRPDVPTAYVAPRNALEEQIAGIWQQALGIEHVGMHDNFFELGGDSVVGIQMLARFRQAGLQLSPPQLFQYQTVAELSTVLASTRATEATPGVESGPALLTPFQGGFFEQQIALPDHATQAVLLELRQPLDPSLLAHAVQHVLGHHDALCLRFTPGASGWQQHHARPDEAGPVTRVDLSLLSAAAQDVALAIGTATAQTSLNITQGPLLRVLYYDLGAERLPQVLIVVHTLLIDTASWRILLADCAVAWQQLSRGEAVQLPPQTTTLQQWATGVAAPSAALHDELAYWLAAPWAQAGALPVDMPGGANTAASARTVSLSLHVDDTRALLDAVPRAYQTTTDEVLLTALGQALTQWTGEGSFVVDLDSRARDVGSDARDLSRTVGALGAVFPALLELGADDAPGERLKAVKEQLRAIPRGGLGYGVRRYLQQDRQSPETLRALPQAEVRFTFLDQVEQMVPTAAPYALVRGPIEPVHTPQGSRQHALEVKAWVAGGRLHLAWLYSQNLHRQETVEGLAQACMGALRLLIAHCQSPEAGGYTPSDFPLADVNQQQLDQIMARLGKAQR